MNRIFFLLKIIIAEKTDYLVLTTTEPRQAIELCKAHDADVLISSLRMPEMESIKLLSIIKQTDPNLPLILNTAFGAIGPSVEALSQQAFDFITPPFKKEQILMTIDKALNWRQEQLRAAKC
jgi:two-component system OmpR family response regulator